MSDEKDTTPPPETTGVLDWNAERGKRGLSRVIIPDPEKVIPGAQLIPAPEHGVDVCRHERVFVDGKKREVLCQACDAELDPVWVLHQYAMKERQFVQNTTWGETEKKRLNEEVESLKRMKAALKRQSFRDDLVAKIKKVEKERDTAVREAYVHHDQAAKLRRQITLLGKKPCV